MYPSLTGPLPKSSYLRLLEYQRQRMVLPAYAADLPLLLFIFFSRISAGLSILSVFFPHSALWLGTAFCCMVLATAASVTHLTVPTRFFTMIINHRSPLVWEIRLAGALTASLGAQVLSDMGYLPGFGVILPWTSFSLAILFLISTGWAYRFHTHPAWKTHILFGYYLASALMTGFALYSITSPNFFFRLITVTLLCTEGFLILLYLNHLCKTSWISLKRIDSGKDRRVSAGISCIGSSSPRSDYFRSPLHESFRIICCASGTEQWRGNRFGADSLLPVGATRFFPFQGSESRSDNDEIRNGVEVRTGLSVETL